MLRKGGKKSVGPRTKRKVDLPATRQLVLEAAAREFAHKGVDGVTLEEIAKKVAIRAASIFHHFPGGKNQLYQEILSNMTATFSQKLAIGLGQGKEATDILVELGEQYWDYCEEYPAHASLILREALDPSREQVREFHFNNSALLNLAQQYIRTAQKAGKLRTFDVESFIFTTSTLCVAFHGAPGLRINLWRGISEKEMLTKAKHSFLHDIRELITPTA